MGTKRYESQALHETLNKCQIEYESYVSNSASQQAIDKNRFREKYSAVLKKIEILNSFLGNNPLGEQNPLLKYKVLENRKALMQEYDARVLEENYAKIHAADVYAKKVIRSKNEHSKIFEEELKKFRILKELENTNNEMAFADQPLQLDQIASCLKEFEEY